MKTLLKVLFAGVVSLLIMSTAGVAANSAAGDVGKGKNWGEKQDAEFLSEMLSHYDVGPFTVGPVIESTESLTAKKLGEGILKDVKAREKQIKKLMDAKEVSYEADYKRNTDKMIAKFTNDVMGETKEKGMSDVIIGHSLEVIGLALPALAYSSDGDVRDLAKEIIIERVTNMARAKNLPYAMSEEERLLQLTIDGMPAEATPPPGESLPMN